MLQKVSLKVKFSDTDIFSHPTSYYPGVSVFTKGNMLLLEKEGSSTEVAKITHDDQSIKVNE